MLSPPFDMEKEDDFCGQKKTSLLDEIREEIKVYLAWLCLVVSSSATNRTWFVLIREVPPIFYSLWLLPLLVLIVSLEWSGIKNLSKTSETTGKLDIVWNQVGQTCKMSMGGGRPFQILEWKSFIFHISFPCSGHPTSLIWYISISEPAFCKAMF